MKSLKVWGPVVYVPTTRYYRHNFGMSGALRGKTSIEKGIRQWKVERKKMLRQTTTNMAG